MAHSGSNWENIQEMTGYQMVFCIFFEFVIRKILTDFCQTHYKICSSIGRFLIRIIVYQKPLKPAPVAAWRNISSRKFQDKSFCNMVLN